MLEEDTGNPEKKGNSKISAAGIEVEIKSHEDKLEPLQILKKMQNIHKDKNITKEEKISELKKVCQDISSIYSNNDNVGE